MGKISCFKAYDVRGKVPSELNAELAYNTGRAFAHFVAAKRVVIGHDVRQSSEEISTALANGLTDAGVNVIDIGLCGTEMIYFATSYLDTDGGIMITASHNPPEYNGMKFVRAKSVPVGYDSGLDVIEKMITEATIPPAAKDKGTLEQMDISAEFVENLKKFYDPAKMKPYTVVVNAGNGCVGPILKKLEPLLPVKMVKLFFTPDSTFPNGVPNPMLEANRLPTIEAVKQHYADLGVAWDGDYDRCFFFDEKGNFIEGYYVVGLLAKSILQKFPGEKIVHDPRLTWNTIEIVKQFKGEPVLSKSGHAYIKQKMREVNSIYGGEMSAHHYFRDNAYSDSGIIPFLLVLQLMAAEGKTFSELVGEMIQNYPCSGEINSTIADPAAKIQELDAAYPGGEHDYLDGLCVEYPDWRFNVRMSNTEPIIRLNVESKGNEELMKEKTAELLARIRG